MERILCIESKCTITNWCDPNTKTKKQKQFQITISIKTDYLFSRQHTGPIKPLKFSVIATWLAPHKVFVWLITEYRTTSTSNFCRIKRANSMVLKKINDEKKMMQTFYLHLKTSNPSFESEN